MEELIFILEELYMEYGLNDIVIRLSKYVDKIIVEEQKRLFEEYQNKEQL